MQRRLALQSLAAAILLGLAAWLANGVAARWPARLDLTADQRFTLSPLTRATLAGLDAPVELHAFLPTHAQPPYSVVVRAMRDQLEDYRVAAEGRVRVHYYDPTDLDLDPAARAALAERARGYGVQQVDLQVVQGDRQLRERVYFGVAVLYRDRQVTVPPVERPEDLEYALTRALREILRGPARRPLVVFSQGHGEPDVLQSPLARVLDGVAELRNVRLDESLVPPEADALVILGPMRPFRERARYAVDRFLLQGKSVVALLDYLQQSEVFPDVLVPVTSALEPQLAHYGLDVQLTDTVLDRTRSAPAPVGRDAQGRVIAVHHPLFVATRALAPDHTVTSRLSELVFPLAHPIEIIAAADREATVLVRGEPTARRRAQVRSLDPAPLGEPDPSLEKVGETILAVALTGPLPAYYADRPIPPPPAGAPPDPPPIVAPQGPARLLLATSGRRLLAAHEAALPFLQNAIDWAVADTDLAELRGRRRPDPPLAPVEATWRAAIKYGNLVVPPLLIAAFGLARRWRRQRRQR